jgi:hypothetical protein
MDEQTYKKWWPLHLRASKGEELTSAEREFYEAELKKLHDEELIEFDSVRWRNSGKAKNPAAVRAKVKEAVARAAAQEK